MSIKKNEGYRGYIELCFFDNLVVPFGKIDCIEAMNAF